MEPLPENLDALWTEYSPQLFDMHAVGILLVLLACPSLRDSGRQKDDSLKKFNEELEKCGHDLLSWRTSGKAAKEATILDANDGAGWELAAKLLTPRGKTQQPPSAEEAIQHAFFL
mmetsp:Transcript_19317/g.37305  ORF Transcript_19317/g.37305 Transcript_19317/m.37305 type:complete len:116 (+) Transcript_19317:1817-2164(+)